MNRSGYLKGETINNLLNEQLNKIVDHGQRLWLLCNAEIWDRMFTDEMSKEELYEAPLRLSTMG
ncbi:hypothetical protein AC481_00715 [miscellaneous Crenarchaeota group archaeon SMTZ-80]|nr:MAG: hypothetical protein AC481_00715 [miscellaneous Crenarchaeota group archaeon SMTZ-80]